MSAAEIRARLEDMNYARDARNCERDEAPVLFLEDGTEKTLPTTWVVCHVCNGAGTHVNPSIDCGGISAEEMHDDPDFAEDYFAGTYDIACNRCGGRTTERAVDWDRLSEADAKAYRQQLADDAAGEREAYYERRAGA